MLRRERRTGRSRQRRPAKDASLDETYIEALGESASAEDAATDTLRETRPERKTFGNAWIELEIAEEGQRAILHELSFGGDTSLGRKDVHKALEEFYLLTFGINQELVDQLADQACASPGKIIRGRFPVASGTPPEPGEDGRILCKCLDDETAFALPYQELKKALEQTELETVVAQNLKACLVGPGEELAELVLPTEGKPGRDVLGNLRQSPGEPAILEPGQNVKKVGDRYFAETYGYLCLIGDQVSVLSPIWASPDRMEAHFVFFPQEKTWRRPEMDWLVQLLEQRDVRHGIQDAFLESLSNRTIDNPKPAHFILARGTPPVPGVDAHIEYSFNPDQMAGRILEDGSIDLRERNSAVSVTADQLLGTVVPATKGQPGVDLTSEELPTTDGTDQEFEAGENVRTEEQDGATVFLAEIDGVVTLQGGKLGVNPVLQINGDVNYEIGNVDVAKDVQISGCVRPGFTVRAGGNITVGDLVEDGAELHAKGDIIAAKGIVGESTKVIALGNVEAKFIQNSSLMVKGDIVVGSYIFNARVRAGGSVVVNSTGGDRGGSIVGGEVFATKGIKARSIGSSTTGHTVVGIGPEPEVAARLAKIRKVIDFCDANILRMLRTLGLQTVDAAQIKALIQRTPPSRKQLIVDTLKKLNKLVTTRDQSLVQRRELEEQVALTLKKANIEVAETAFANITVHMGNDTSTVAEDLRGLVFFKDDDGIRYRPL